MFQRVQRGANMSSLVSDPKTLGLIRDLSDTLTVVEADRQRLIAERDEALKTRPGEVNPETQHGNGPIKVGATVRYAGVSTTRNMGPEAQWSKDFKARSASPKDRGGA
jgi:hypothetical protein